MKINNKDSRFSSVISMGKDKEELLTSVLEESKVKKVDLCAGHSDFYDFFIINDSDFFLKSKLITPVDLGLKEAFKRLRILLINKGYYYVQPNFKVNEGYYYLYRFKKVFEAFQPAWSNIVALRGNIYEDELFHQFDSLSQRLEFLCRANDKLSFEALKSANNDTQGNTLYHLGYFIMLITGVFDDLAWIINHLYGLNLNKMDVILKKIPKRNKFYNRLINYNQKLYDYLTNEETQKYINLFYPLRDSLQHRRFVKGMVLSKQRGVKANVFEFPIETVNIIETLKKEDSLKDFGLVTKLQSQYLFDPYVFSNKSFESVADIVNNILNRIEWTDFLKELPHEKIEELEKSQEELACGLHNFLQIGVKPLYFDY